MARFVYSPEQLAWLRAKCSRLAIGKLTADFNARFELAKTEGQIRAVQSNHQINGGRGPKEGRRPRLLVNQEQAAFIAVQFPLLSIAALTAAVNAKYGLSLLETQLKSYTSNHAISSGRSGRFVKGELPWNTGRKGYMGANCTSFRKGAIPPNRQPLGTERICPKDGYIQIKIAETNPYTGAPTRYKNKQQVVWEREHGPVPKGMVVRLIDGDKTNCAPENLLLISRAEHLRLTRLGVNDYPLELRPSVVAIAKLEVKTFDRIRQLKEVAA